MITISVPDNTVRISYSVMSDDGTWEQDPKPITADMLVKVEVE